MIPDMKNRVLGEVQRILSANESGNDLFRARREGATRGYYSDDPGAAL
jgi:hypothetical protein